MADALVVREFRRKLSELADCGDLGLDAILFNLGEQCLACCVVSLSAPACRVLPKILTISVWRGMDPAEVALGNGNMPVQRAHKSGEVLANFELLLAVRFEVLEDGWVNHDRGDLLRRHGGVLAGHCESGVKVR